MTDVLAQLSITKVFIVGDDGPEHNLISSVHKTYEGALKAWNMRRLELLREAKSFLESDKDTGDSDMWQAMIKNLSCDNPDKIENFPWETPYIREYEVKE